MEGRGQHNSGHCVKGGDEIQLEENYNSLIINTSKKSEFELKEIDVSELDLLLPRALHTLYKRGFDELE